MNEMLFVFSHSGKVNYNGNLCPHFHLEGGLIRLMIFFKGVVKWGLDNILVFKKGKNAQNCFSCDNMVIDFWILLHFRFKKNQDLLYRVLASRYLRGIC